MCLIHTSDASFCRTTYGTPETWTAPRVKWALKSTGDAGQDTFKKKSRYRERSERNSKMASVVMHSLLLGLDFLPRFVIMRMLSTVFLCPYSVFPVGRAYTAVLGFSLS